MVQSFPEYFKCNTLEFLRFKYDPHLHLNDGWTENEKQVAEIVINPCHVHLVQLVWFVF